MPKINQEEYEILKELDDKWEWIARDEDKSLWVFTEKPFRKSEGISQSCWDTEIGRSYPVLELIDEIHLFQFIQWEDEEPYSIQGLINEYLDDEYGYFNMKLSREFEEFIKKESEEAEMTKSIEWLKNEVNKLPIRFLGFSVLKQREEFTVDKTDVLELINQLDEPEVLSQEWIDEHKYPDTEYPDEHYVWEISLQNLLVPKQEVLSQKWIDNNSVYASSDGITEEYVHVDDLKELLVPKQDEREQLEIAYKDILEREEFWFDDKKYKVVEVEQKYYVMNNDNRMMLCRKMDDKTITEADPFKLEAMYEGEKESHRLTEQEIKDYDPRYMVFAKPVEEVD